MTSIDIEYPAAIAMGWLSADPLALTAVGARLLDRLAGCPHDRLSDEQLRTVAAHTEALIARVTAVSADVAGEIERRGHERESGFFSTRAVIEHRHRLCRATSTERTQTMRMFALLPGWADAARAGTVGADQVALIARTAANRRITDELIEHGDDLLADARTLAYPAFEDRVRMFVRLADVDGTRTVDQRNRDRRNVTLGQFPDGSWRLRGRLPALFGAQINETFAHFIVADFHTDLIAAQEAAGGGEPDWSALARTEPQRRADALLAISWSAAAAPNGRSTPGRRSGCFSTSTHSPPPSTDDPSPSLGVAMSCAVLGGEISCPAGKPQR